MKTKSRKYSKILFQWVYMRLEKRTTINSRTENLNSKTHNLN